MLINHIVASKQTSREMKFFFVPLEWEYQRQHKGHCDADDELQR